MQRDNVDLASLGQIRTLQIVDPTPPPEGFDFINSLRPQAAPSVPAAETGYRQISKELTHYWPQEPAQSMDMNGGPS